KLFNHRLKIIYPNRPIKTIFPHWNRLKSFMNEFQRLRNHTMILNILQSPLKKIHSKSRTEIEFQQTNQMIKRQIRHIDTHRPSIIETQSVEEGKSIVVFLALIFLYR